MTAMGLILGTAAYMAPEQARGKPVDKRADVWAFGVVLYEMLTGRRAFAGDEISDVLAAVLRRFSALQRQKSQQQLLQTAPTLNLCSPTAAASAAASSSSGFEPVPFSKRDPKMYAPAKPDSPLYEPVPPLSPPFHTALAFRVGIPNS